MGTEYLEFLRFIFSITGILLAITAPIAYFSYKLECQQELERNDDK